MSENFHLYPSLKVNFDCIKPNIDKIKQFFCLYTQNVMCGSTEEEGLTIVLGRFDFKIIAKINSRHISCFTMFLSLMFFN